jgi:PDZ domain
VPQLIQSGKVTDFGLADLGLQGTTVDATAAAQLQLPVTQGVLVASVDATGPAAQAGLKAGEVIVRLNDTAVTDEAGQRAEQEPWREGGAAGLPWQPAFDGERHARQAEHPMMGSQCSGSW